MQSFTVRPDHLAKSTSLGAVIYQAGALCSDLESITLQDYPPEACAIRDVILCFADYLQDELRDLYDPNAPLNPLKDPAFVRTRSLALALRTLYSYLRYIKASAPRQSPPGIQLAMSALTDYHFPSQNGHPVCLIRPQWKYNFSFVSINLFLRQLGSPGLLSPDNKLNVTKSIQLLPALWKRYQEKIGKSKTSPSAEECPQQLAILSFAALDTQDCLLYPLLAHELGHFIDYSFEPPLSLTNKVVQLSAISVEKLNSTLLGNQIVLQPVEVKKVLNEIFRRISACLREILADLIATRIFGFSFFVAQAEFLKTLSPWPSVKVEASGYPGIKFRLQTIFNQLLMPSFLGNPEIFFAEQLKAETEISEKMGQFLKGWKERFQEHSNWTQHHGGHTNDKLHRVIEELADNAVASSLNELFDLAKIAIPDAKCCRLNVNIFKRIENLDNDHPPSVQGEDSNAYSEILTSAWCYQIIYGEQKEARLLSHETRHAEYKKTCRLVMKAIELVSAPGSSLAKLSTGVTHHHSELQYLNGVLSTNVLQRRTQLSVKHPGHLGIIPRSEGTFCEASLEFRLGHWFSFARRTRLAVVRIGDKNDEATYNTIGKEEVFVPTGKSFLLHPGDFVLGSTLEFISLPNDLMAFVEGKSSPGRAGLTVATATTVAPGFHGVLILELANTGSVPLELFPGVPIGQLAILNLSNMLTVGYKGKFYCQIKP